MTSGSIGPGTVLAGRYRLDDLLTESEGARFWRATDTILARSVAVHAVPSDDERAAGLLEAARISATVTDPHLLRVLDCDDEGGITWVVNEWGEGVSLDLMLLQGTLPPSRAAWLTREVADAIAAGHAQDVPHGRLNPEAVLVTEAGAVKLIGYVVDASLEPDRPPDPVYGELDEREADVINLAGVLYAALTGRWPGVAPSGVPKAPREGRRPLRPRQVRAGVPRTLDVICERVLHKEASQHAMPIETAQEIAAALADFLGDSGMAAPLDLAGMHSEPTVSIRRDELATGVAGLHEETLAAEAVAGVSSPPAPQPASHQQSAVEPEVEPSPDPEDTQVYQEVRQGPDSLAPLHAPKEPVAPPPPFEDPPERPLFATTERRVPAAARAAEAARAASVASAPPGATATASRGVDTTSGGTGDTGSGFWPFTDEAEAKNDIHTGKEGRGWLRMAIVVGVLLVLVVAMAIAFNRGRQDSDTPSTSGSTPSQSAASGAAGAAITVAGVRDFDPDGDPPEENPDTAKNAIDGDPDTSWTTVTYRGNPALGGLKPGVGLLLDLGKEQKVSSLTVRFKGTPTSYDVYAAPAGVTQPPDSVDQLDKVGGQQSAPEKSTVTLASTPSTRFVVVWLTRLPQVSGGFRGEISDITVRS